MSHSFFYSIRIPHSAFRVLVPLLLAATASAASTWTPPDPVALKDQEIRLLKQQLAQARAQLDTERVGRVVYETQLRVAGLHGFSVKDLVRFEPLTSAVIDRLIDDSIRTQYPGKTLEHYTWLNQLFAALPQPFDMKATVRDLMGEQAAGVYDPHSKKLFVKTDFPLEQPMGQMILAHEICHAYQDQDFSLEEMGVEEAEDSDLAAATLSVAEGDATLLMVEYFGKFGNPLSMLRSLPGMLSMDQRKLEQAPPAIQESLLFPYLEGMKFFQGLRGRTRGQAPGGRAYPDPQWRNALFKDPPRTTQQILHPELYLSGKLPEKVRAPKIPNASKPTVNVAGEFGIRLLLQPMLGAERAAAAAEGWNGDRIAVADAGDGRRRLLRWATRWDSAGKADRFAAALEEALAARFAGKLAWGDNGNARAAQIDGARFKLVRRGGAGVDLEGDIDPALTFPKVKIKISRNPLLGF